MKGPMETGAYVPDPPLFPFAWPSRGTSHTIAEEVGISLEAASERIRRGTETVLRKALIGLMVSDFDDSNGE